MKRLKWDGLQYFNQMKWTALEDPQTENQTGAFYKTYKNFAFYWILKAGHMVQYDTLYFSLFSLGHKENMVNLICIYNFYSAATVLSFTNDYLSFDHVM